MVGFFYKHFVYVSFFLSNNFDTKINCYTQYVKFSNFIYELLDNYGYTEYSPDTI